MSCTCHMVRALRQGTAICPCDANGHELDAVVKARKLLRLFIVRLVLFGCDWSTDP